MGVEFRPDRTHEARCSKGTGRSPYIYHKWIEHVGFLLTYIDPMASRQMTQ